MAWESPTGFVDPDTVWDDEVLAYDENTDTYAYTFITDKYLELTHASISCSKVRINISRRSVGVHYDPDIDIDVYYSGAWHNIFSGTVTKQIWVEKEIGSTQDVTAARVKSNEFLTFPQTNMCFFEFDFWEVPPPPVAPTVTTQAVTGIGVTTATGNGTITAIGSENCTRRGVCWNTTGNPTVADSTSDEVGSFGTGAFSRPMTGLSASTHYYVRAYAYNSGGYGYGSQVEFDTLPPPPAAPTNVQATDGAHTDKVVVTWTKSAGATSYQVYRDGVALSWLGDVATYDDLGSDAPSITPGSSAASDGAYTDKVALSLSGTGTNNGTTHTYKVRARSAGGESPDSATDTGYRAPGALTYQWQRSAADSDASYSDISGATTASYDDTGAPVAGGGRYYRCRLNAAGAAQQYSTSDRGYRLWEPPTPPVTPEYQRRVTMLKKSDGSYEEWISDDEGRGQTYDPKVGSLISYEGTTTSNGAGDGSTLIDSVLATKPDYNGNLVIITSGAYAGQARDINGVTTGGTVTPNLAFDGQIVSGVTFTIVGIRTVPAEVAAIAALIGTATDAADLGTLFGRHLREYLGTHTHALVVVHDTSALDADLDTALQQWLLDVGFIVTLADPTDVAGELHVNAFDLVVVSASCVAADVANLANLRTVEAPVICHSADIAASVVLDMGGTPHTEAAETQIEITDNTPTWLITLATGDLTVTAAADIYAMNTKTAAAVTLAEEATGTGNHLTVVMLSAGEDNEVGYAAFYDRFFSGVGDYTNMNAVWKAVMEELVMHCVMEKRFTVPAIVQVKGVYQEDVPDTGFTLAAIDVNLTNPPPSADTENSIVDIDKKNSRTYVLRSLWANITNLGGGTATMTFKLWIDIGGTPTQVDSVDVTSTGYQNLMDLFGLPEVHADSIHITAQVNAGTGACAGIYRYAEAKK